jgi:class 3 adenylate cyclase
MMPSSGFSGSVAVSTPTLVDRLAAFLPPVALPDPGQVQQTFEGTVLCARIDGLAALAESLAKTGREGAEVLSRVLTNYVGVLTATVVRHGGQLLTLDGTTVLAYFPGDNSSAQIAEAQLLDFASRFRPVQTNEGRYTLSLKTGIEQGSFRLAVLGADLPGRTLLFIGDVFDRARAAVENSGSQPAAGANDKTTAELLEADYPTAQKLFGDEDPLSVYNRLSPYLPRTLAQKLKTHPDAPLTGEFRRAVNIFVHLTDVDLNNPADLNALQTYYLNAQRVCSGLDGHVNQIVAYETQKVVRLHLTFGALLSNSEDAEHALRAALNVRDIPTPSGTPPVLGVANGNVFVGSVGSQYCQRYVVLGDVVNLSARFADAAAEQGDASVLVDRYTRERVGLAFLFGEDIIINVPSSPFPVRASRLLAPRPAAASLVAFVREQAPSGILPTSVLGTFDEVLNGQRRVIVVSESGQTAHLAQRWLKRGGNGAAGACVLNASSVPYLAWSGLLGGLIGLNPQDSRTEKAAKLSQAIARYAAEYNAQSGWLNMLIGLAPEEPGFRQRIAGQRQQFSKMVVSMLKGMSATTPQMLILRDLQWSDEPGFELLETAIRELEQSPILFCLTHQRGGQGEFDERVSALPGLVL